MYDIEYANFYQCHLHRGCLFVSDRLGEECGGGTEEEQCLIIENRIANQSDRSVNIHPC